MRTTLDIDDDVLNAAKDMARREHTRAGVAISFRPFPSRGAVVTNEAIDELRDSEGV
jgi:hypothetical protein